MITVLAIVIAYLLGSVSTSIIVCRLAGKADPRTLGSKNPGATNVLRVAGKKLAIVALIGDILKGFLAVSIGKILGLDGFDIGLVALAAFLGHLYPVYFEFKGGKGVATLIGCMLSISPFLGLAVGLTWVVVAVISRYSSLAALVAAVLAPFYALFFSRPATAIPLAIMTLLLIWRHRENIERLRDGTEGKIGEKAESK